MKKWKRLIGFIVFVLVLSSVSIPAFAGEWKRDTNGWWYQRDDGTYPAGQWVMLNTLWYYFQDDGYLVCDGRTPDGYWVDQNGTWIQDIAPIAVYRNPVSVEEVINKVYVNRYNGYEFEIGQYNGDGTIYANLTDPKGYTMWSGEAIEVYAYNVNGVGIRFAGDSGLDNWVPENSVTVTWTSREAMDYPEVTQCVGYFHTNVSEFYGSYEYLRLLFAPG